MFRAILAGTAPLHPGLQSTVRCDKCDEIRQNRALVMFDVVIIGIHTTYFGEKNLDCPGSFAQQYCWSKVKKDIRAILIYMCTNSSRLWDGSSD